MFRSLLLTISLCLIHVAVQAQDAPASAGSPETISAGGAEGVSPDELEARREATRHLLEILNVDEQYDQTIAQTMQMADQMIAQNPGLEEAEREKARTLARAGMEASLHRLSWDRLGPIIVEIYAEVFTVEEITGLTDFFETAIGQAFIEKQPQLTAATMRRVGVLIQEEMPIIQAEIEAAVQAVEAESSSDAP